MGPWSHDHRTELYLCNFARSHLVFAPPGTGPTTATTHSTMLRLWADCAEDAGAYALAL
jgi:hypothetical protein